MRVKLIVANVLLVSASIVLIALMVAYFEHPVVKLNQQLQAFLRDPNTQTLQRWLDANENLAIFSQSPQAGNDAQSILNTYAESFGDYNKQNWPWLMPIRINQLALETELVTFSTEPILTSYLPKDIAIVLREGQDQITPVISLDWEIEGKRFDINANLKPTQQLVTELRQVGTATSAELELLLQESYQKLTQGVLQNDLASLLKDSDITDVALLEIQTKPNLASILTNTKVVKPSFQESNKPLTKETEFVIDTLVSQTNCPLTHQIQWSYDWQKQKYVGHNLGAMIKGLCTSPGVVQLTCKDCSLAPVDKVHKLSPDYIPRVVNTQVLGGGQLTPLAAQALRNMFAAAAQEKVSVKVLSAYRSYEQQVGTYEYWVKLELAKGKPRAQAEIDANKYSALPGFSEHQLGTTADLACADCRGFEGVAGNFALYNFLERRAHEFGFVVSYPRNTEQFTGYRYEPWHIRFVGVALAKELHTSNYLKSNGNYLAKLLLQKSIY